MRIPSDRKTLIRFVCFTAWPIDRSVAQPSREYWQIQATKNASLASWGLITLSFLYYFSFSFLFSLMWLLLKELKRSSSWRASAFTSQCKEGHWLLTEGAQQGSWFVLAQSLSGQSWFLSSPLNLPLNLPWHCHWLCRWLFAFIGPIIMYQIVFATFWPKINPKVRRFHNVIRFCLSANSEVYRVILKKVSFCIFTESSWFSRKKKILLQKAKTKCYLWASFHDIWSSSKSSKLDIQKAISG